MENVKKNRKYLSLNEYLLMSKKKRKINFHETKILSLKIFNFKLKKLLLIKNKSIIKINVNKNQQIVSNFIL